MTPAHLRFPRAWVLALFLPLALAACGHEPDDPVANQAPSVRITSGPPEASEDSYTARVWWTGWDTDGVISFYEYALDPPEAFSLEEIGDPEGAGLRRQVLRGPEAGADTLVYSKDVDGATTSFRWIQTREFVRSFVFRTPRADSVGSGSSAGPIPRFSGFHTVYVRSRDNEEAYSPPDRLSFTAVTATPSAYITRPLISGETLFVGTQIRICWDGVDIDSPEPDKKPVAYMFKLVNLTELDPPVNPLNISPKFILFDHPGVRDTPWRIQSADTLCTSYFLEAPAVYLFAVRAIDVAGAVEPFVDKVRGRNPGNVAVFQAQARGGAPTLNVTEASLGDVDGNALGVRGLATTEFEVPVGIPLRFLWTANAEAYGGVIEGFNWGINIPDLDREGPNSGWTGWSNLGGNLNSIVFTRPGVNTVNIKVRDTAGAVTIITIILRVIEFPFDRELLIVDDVRDAVYPRDPERDNFWMQLAQDSGRIPESELPRDVLLYNTFGDNDTQYLTPIPPNLSTLGRYRRIVWDVRGGGSGGVTGLLLSAPIRRHIGAYLRTGGQFWVTGEQTLAAMTPTSTGLADFTNPKEILPGTFVWNFLHLYSSRISNAGYDRTERDGMKSVRPWTGTSHGFPEMEIDTNKQRSGLAGKYGIGGIDAVFDPLFAQFDPNFRGRIDSVYAYVSFGQSAYNGKLAAIRYTDTDPEPAHGRVVWFGFPFYYLKNDQAQETFNHILDWFREEVPVP